MSSIQGKTLGQEAHGTGYDRLEQWFFQQNEAAKARARELGHSAAAVPESAVLNQVATHVANEAPAGQPGKRRWQLIEKLVYEATRPRPTCIGQFPI